MKSKSSQKGLNLKVNLSALNLDRIRFIMQVYDTSSHKIIGFIPAPSNRLEDFIKFEHANHA